MSDETGADYRAATRVMGAFTHENALRVGDIQKVLLSRGTPISAAYLRHVLRALVGAGRLKRIHTGLYALPGFYPDKVDVRAFVVSLVAKDPNRSITLGSTVKAARARFGDVIPKELIELEINGLDRAGVLLPGRWGSYRINREVRLQDLKNDRGGPLFPRLQPVNPFDD